MINVELLLNLTPLKILAMKKKSEYIESIEKLSSINDVLFTSNLIDYHEYDSNCKAFMMLIIKYIQFTDNQKKLISIAGNDRICITKFRLCITMIFVNLN